MLLNCLNMAYKTALNQQRPSSQGGIQAMINFIKSQTKGKKNG